MIVEEERCGFAHATPLNVFSTDLSFLRRATQSSSLTPPLTHSDGATTPVKSSERDVLPPLGRVSTEATEVGIEPALKHAGGLAEPLLAHTDSGNVAGPVEVQRGWLHYEGTYAAFPWMHESSGECSTELDPEASNSASTLSLRQRPMLAPGGVKSSVFNLTCATLGVGVLSLPLAAFNLGLVLFVSLLILFAYLTIVSTKQLIHAVNITELSTYEAMAYKAGKKRLAVLMEVMLIFACFGSAVGYLVSVRDIVKVLLNAAVLPSSFMQSRPQIAALMKPSVILSIFTLCLMLPLCLAGGVSELGWVSLLGVTAIEVLVVVVVARFYSHGLAPDVFSSIHVLGTCAQAIPSDLVSAVAASAAVDITATSTPPVVLPYASALSIPPEAFRGSFLSARNFDNVVVVTQLPETARVRLSCLLKVFLSKVSIGESAFWPRSFSSTVKALPLIVFAFTCQANVPAIYKHLEKQNYRRMLKVSYRTTSLAFVTYLVVGICGFLTFGKSVPPNILLGFEDEIGSRWFTQFGFLCMAIALCLSYPLNVIPCAFAAQKLLDGHHQSRNARVTVFMTVVASLLLSILIPRISVVFELTGSTSCAFVAFLAPSLFVLKFLPGSLRTARKQRAVLVMCIGVFIAIVSTYVTVRDLLKNQHRL